MWAGEILRAKREEILEVALPGTGRVTYASLARWLVARLDRRATWTSWSSCSRGGVSSTSAASS